MLEAGIGGSAVAEGGAKTPPALELRAIEKSYGGVRALEGVDLTCVRGEVHALLGENGAGKSTLVNVASGNVVQDAGTVRIGGVELTQADPDVARRLGLAVAYQDDSLIPDLTVAENLVLGSRPEDRPPWPAVRDWAAGALDRWATSIDPDAPVRELPIAVRQIVEIVKALSRNPSLLILDEPTAALTAGEAGHLHRLVHEVAAQGTGVVYITHRLAEVLALADRISILRDGALVADAIPRADVDEEQLVSRMVGRSLDTTFPAKAAREELGRPTVVLADASGAGFSNVSLEARAGEILGLAGIEGNGQRELLRALAGLERHDGRLDVCGKEIPAGSVRAGRRAGTTFVSGDRSEEAVFPGLSVRQNMTAGALGQLQRLGMLTPRRERLEIAPHLESLAIRMPSQDHPLASLSGGNQQKVAFGRTLLEQPSVYLVEEPTQGVDAGTRVQIYRLLRAEARRGATIVVLSSDALELAGLCDRVVVLSRGHAIAELAGEELDEDRIVAAAAQSGVARAAGGDDETTAHSIMRFARRNDFAPVLLLAATTVLLLAFVTVSQPTFLSTGNMSNLLFIAVPLGFVALGQAAVMMTGGIDLSIGPLVSLTTVLMASIMSASNEAASVLLAVLAALGVGAAVGLLNALLVRKVKLQPLIATLATYVLVQGVALLMMATPGGYVSRDFATAAGQLVGFVPIAFLALLGLAVLAELVYRRSPRGMAFRAVGSRPAAARRIGVRSERVYYLAYVLGGLMGGLAGIFFTATIQIGDPNLGVSFTLASITAVVLGGMSTWGGRGSIVGAIAGALLLGVIANGTQFLGYPPEVQYYAQGGLLIGAIALYSKLRATGRSRYETASSA